VHHLDVEAAPIVSHVDPECVVVLDEGHGDRPRLCMLSDVCQRLLGAPIDQLLDGEVISCRAPAHVGLRVDLACDLRDQHVERLEKSLLVEDRRA